MFNLQPGIGLGFSGNRLIAFGLGHIYGIVKKEILRLQSKVAKNELLELASTINPGLIMVSDIQLNLSTLSALSFIISCESAVNKEFSVRSLVELVE